MGAMTLAGGSALTYGSETWSTEPGAAYSAWCSAAGVSGTDTLQALDADDEAFLLTLQSPFFASGPGSAFFSTEGGFGFYEGAPANVGSVFYEPAELPSVNRFIGLWSKPRVVLTYHPDDSDLQSLSVKIQKSGNTTLIYALHTAFDDPEFGLYEFSLKITPQLFEMVGKTFSTNTSVLLTEYVENTEYPAAGFVQQSSVQTQLAGTNYRYTVSVATVNPQGLVAVDSPLGVPMLMGNLTQPTLGFASALGPLGAASVVGNLLLSGGALMPSPLGGARVLGLHDFTGQLGDALTLYVMDIVNPGGPLRLPISSWQATLQTSGSNYVQCVVPACAPWAAAINTATEFVIYRMAVLPGAAVYEYEMARSPAEQVSFDQGPERYTCTLSGYSNGFAEDLDPPAAYDRALTGVRSISSGAGGVRVRCAVDWLLRPGHRAFANGVPLVVGFINYYAPTGFDAYMDVGSRA